MRRLAGVVALVVEFAWAAAPTEAKRVALVIGNGAYQSVSELKNPKNDATAIADALVAVGFDEVVRRDDLDQRSLLRALQEFSDLSAGADTAVVYFAGHGVEVDNRNYLVPTDASLAKVADVEFEAVPLDAVRTAVSSASKLRLVILDACRNNPFKLASDGKKRSVGRGLARVEPDANELIAYAAKEGTVAADGEGANSPFAAALVKHLAEPGLEINFLFRRVRDDVVAATGKVQEPFTYGTLGAEEMYLNPPAVGGKVEDGKPTASPVADPAAAAWSIAENSNSRDMLEAIIRRFPDTIYADFAQAKLKAMEREVAVVVPAEPAPEPTLAGCDGLVVSVGLKANSKDDCLKPGDVFRDLADGPEMVVVPAGRFTMGSPDSEEGRSSDEGPQHEVTIGKPFAVGKVEVTFDEWQACVKARGCSHKPEDRGWGKGRRPVINVSWDDAKQYVKWLSKATGKTYRLLSESEWEYAARAGTTTPFSFGETISTDEANYNGDYTYGAGSKGERRDKTVEVGSFAVNGFGLAVMHGNVWEWVEDCYIDSYKDGPNTEAPRTTGSCDIRVLRGGSWGINPRVLRSANRYRIQPGSRFAYGGFRLARTLTP